MLDRERRLESRRSPLALTGLYECGFVAADVGPGTQLDADVEPVAEYSILAQLHQLPCQVVAQIHVLRAKVEDAMPGANAVGRDRHAHEYLLGAVGQQRPVLEGPWLALIGVADDVLLVAGGCAAELPLVAGGETRAAKSPQARLGDGGDHVLGSHRQAAAQQRAVIGVTAEEHRPRRVHGGACQRIDIRHIVAWQASRIGDLRRRFTPFQPLDDLAHRSRCQVCEHDIIDEHCRFVVTQPNARGFKQPEIDRPGPAESCPGVEFQGLIHLAVAVHFRDDGVAQINPVTARRRGVEEMVERRGLQNILDGQPEPIGYPGGGFSGNVAGFALHIPQDVDERSAVWLAPSENRRDTGSHRCCTTQSLRVSSSSQPERGITRQRWRIIRGHLTRPAWTRGHVLRNRRCPEVS